MRHLILGGLVLLLAAPLASQQRSRSPHGDLPVECKACHASKGWTPVRITRAFDHSKFGFRLQGAHTTATCRACHQSLDFKGAKSDCTSCHSDIHRGELGADCARCHTPRGFQDREVMLQAHQTSRFPLQGSHVAVDCAGCHTPTGQGRLQFVARSADCVSCHERQFLAARNPDHVASGIPRDCVNCHAPTNWGNGRFNHDATQFPLTGSHRAVGCAQCHANARYQGTPKDCVSCHQTDYNTTTSPRHTVPTFPTTCVSCHGTAGWIPSAFNHDGTRFPLTGAHRAVTCQQCHGDGVYQGKTSSCLGCHQSDYNLAGNPNHAQARFPTDCTSCHSTTGWSPSSFDHDASQFPLTGAHRATTCDQCHADGVYDGKPTACTACHQGEYNATTSPKHTLPTFVTTCTTCHTTTAWAPTSFDHNTTSFPLTGAHRSTTCQQCHADGVYAGKPTTCISCHQADYDNTRTPNHATSGYSTDCTVCHTSTQWPGAAFNHDLTRFPLAGAHRAATCQQCHADGVYAGKPTTCASCHQPDYNQTTAPRHTLPTFVTTCQTCHTATAWSPATFNHGTTQFPLTGAHVAATCAQCHADGVYNGKPTTCVSCHQTDYDATTTPRHTPSTFPTTCNTCHTTTRWTGATFSHSWFKTPHHGIRTCSECHTNANDYKVFACINCHTHNRTAMDDKHRGRNGYTYDSAACYRCHG